MNNGGNLITALHLFLQFRFERAPPLPSLFAAIGGSGGTGPHKKVFACYMHLCI